MFFNWRGQYLFACLTFVSTFRHSVTRGSRRAIWGSATKVLLVIENASTLRHPNARRYREQTVIWSLQATLFIHHYSSHPSYTFQVVRLVGLAIERTLPSTIKTPRFFLLERAISLCLTDHRIHSAPHLAWWGAWGRPLVGGSAPHTPPPPKQKNICLKKKKILIHRNLILIRLVGGPLLVGGLGPRPRRTPPKRGAEVRIGRLW